jgi:hypothetical protein
MLCFITLFAECFRLPVIPASNDDAVTARLVIRNNIGTGVSNAYNEISGIFGV